MPLHSSSLCLASASASDLVSLLSTHLPLRQHSPLCPHVPATPLTATTACCAFSLGLLIHSLQFSSTPVAHCSPSSSGTRPRPLFSFSSATLTSAVSSPLLWSQTLFTTHRRHSFTINSSSATTGRAYSSPARLSSRAQHSLTSVILLSTSLEAHAR